MLVFDFDGVLHDSRRRAWRCYQDARSELELWKLPDLTSPDNLPLIYQGVLSASLTRWIDFESAERFWKRHAELTALAAAHEPGQLIPELTGPLAELAAGQGYAVVTGSHHTTVRSLLRRDLAKASMPQVILSRDEPGSKTEKLRALRQRHRATAYVGDTGSDVRHARAASLTAIAVAYGYASRQDLTAARPDHLLATPADLAAWCRTQPANTAMPVPDRRRPPRSDRSTSP
ncbi:HAD family hydrolase [Streptomyces niveus]|uniref:HAD family hydrolase n=1 Tax=Streptomyces niveus TaxID=193462 RepID=UPI00364620D7